MRIWYQSAPGCDRVILNGDSGGMRDRTTAASFDVVGRDTQGACRVRGLGRHTAALRASYGPSEGYRPPQDEMAKSVISRTPR